MTRPAHQDWHELLRLTQGEDFTLERVRLERGIAIEGDFELPPMARLSAEEQVFAMAFIKSHGSLKEMERLFGISYPTVKGRLARLAAKLDLVEIDPPPARSEVLAQLERGEISADEAVHLLKS